MFRAISLHNCPPKLQNSLLRAFSPATLPYTLPDIQHWVLRGVVLLTLWPAFGLAQPATERFTEHYDQIYQIRDVARSAAAKSSIGSGFQVSADGLIVTNYHVVAGYVNAPANRRLEYLDQQGNSGALELLDFDVINDLALLRHPAPTPKHFSLATAPLTKGALIYALGNPHDLGITLVFGANNGMVEHSYDCLLYTSPSPRDED